jgi:ribonuclease P protein component
MSFHPLGDGEEVTMPLVAYAIDRSCGNAVTRNRLRRRLRAVLADESTLRPGGYLIRTDATARDCTFGELKGAVQACIRVVAEKSERS